MPKGLKRYYGQSHLHFLTFSCYRRLPLLGTPRAINLFVKEPRRVRREYGLRAVAAFEGFVDSEKSYDGSETDGVPDEPAPGGFDWRAAAIPAACAARALRGSGSVRRFQNDAIGSAFGNYAHIIFDSDGERATRALHHKFLGAQDGNLSDCRLVRVGTDDGRGHAEGKRFGIGGGKSGGAPGENRGRGRNARRRRGLECCRTDRCSTYRRQKLWRRQMQPRHPCARRRRKRRFQAKRKERPRQV